MICFPPWILYIPHLNRSHTSFFPLDPPANAARGEKRPQFALAPELFGRELTDRLWLRTIGRLYQITGNKVRERGL